MSQKFTGGATAGQFTPKDVKKNGFGITAGIVVILIAILVAVGYFHPNGRSSNTSNQGAPLAENVITLTTNWSEWVEMGYDKTVVSHLKTPNLWWQVKVQYVGGELEIFNLSPINYPESGMLNLKRPADRVSWRITPPETESLNKKVKLLGELRWHTEPIK